MSMSKIIYVSGYQDNFPELLSIGKQIDWVQNGMIAISAVQSSATSAVIIEDNLPLMTPSRLIKELSATKPNLPIILIIRTEERRKQIIDDFKLGIFGWYEPEHNQESDLNNLLDQAINFYQFFNNLTSRNQKDMSPVGYSDMVGISNSMLSIYRLLAQIRNKDVIYF